MLLALINAAQQSSPHLVNAHAWLQCFHWAVCRLTDSFWQAEYMQECCADASMEAGAILVALTVWCHAQNRCCVFTKKKGLTGWMLRPWGLTEIPVGEMPTRGAPMFTPVADRLMPTGEVLMKQGLYENTEPPPEICIQADRPVTCCHVITAKT